jgi:hypothetical protein
VCVCLCVFVRVCVVLCLCVVHVCLYRHIRIACAEVINEVVCVEFAGTCADVSARSWHGIGVCVIAIVNIGVFQCVCLSKSVCCPCTLCGWFCVVDLSHMCPSTFCLYVCMCMCVCYNYSHSVTRRSHSVPQPSWRFQQRPMTCH